MLKKILLLTMICCCALPAYSETICHYKDRYGKDRTAKSIKLVPKQFQKQAYCQEIRKHSNYLAKPEDVDIGKSIRSENISTPFGRAELRWPRTAEKLFGKTPLRAVADSMRTASRFLKTAGFSEDVRNFSTDWSIVFMDENLPEKQIPSYLISNCHPGWMVPPANIYIVAQRVANGCSGSTGKPGYVADIELAAVLLHEIGHVVEFQLLDKKRNRVRQYAEGFASWFEQESAELSSLARKGAVKEKYFRLAKHSIQSSPDSFVFRGSAHDYARASLYFHAIVKRGSIGHLMDVYEGLGSGSSFQTAVRKRLGWNEKRHNEEVKKLVD